ncbi:MAG: hypothetical protein E7310_07000 [Clostridiales bacterium]|nr:hypothetical protein [Clostridiales bacterium]
MKVYHGIAYYIEYILIVTLVMHNFSEIINMVKDTINNLVGFMNSLVPILMALMTSSRKYCFCKFNSTYNIIYNNFYRKYNYNSNFTNYNCVNNYRNCFKYFRQSSNR